MFEISVLMSVYKSEKPAYFSRSLQSIWDDQILKPDEIVLIEDGPLGKELTDIIDSWKLKLGDRLCLVVNEKNLGLTKSLNKGLTVAQGKYIARMDSDDISLPERFKLQHEFMESHPDISVVGGGLQEIDELGNWGAERRYPQTQEKIKDYIAKANPIAHPTVFIRRKVFEDGFIYNESYRKNQDLKLWFDLIGAGYLFYNLDKTVLHFRRTSETYSKRSSKISLNSELQIYLSGIKSINGLCSWRYIYPITRYVIKSMPSGLNSFVYKYLFKKKNN